MDFFIDFLPAEWIGGAPKMKAVPDGVCVSVHVGLKGVVGLWVLAEVLDDG